jgi:multisubunit Na+/H+ antiporter MnhC subunit
MGSLIAGIPRHAVRAHEQPRLLPSRQIGATGNPISITNKVVSAVPLALVLTAISWFIGYNPTKVYAPE